MTLRRNIVRDKNGPPFSGPSKGRKTENGRCKSKQSTKMLTVTLVTKLWTLSRRASSRSHWAGLFDFDQITASPETAKHTTTINLPLSGAAMADVFDIDWTIVASALGLLMSLFAVWYVRRHRD